MYAHKELTMHVKRSWLPISLFTLAALLGCYGLACAAAGPLDPLPVVPSWMVWLVMFAALLAGFETLLKGLSMILHAIAGRTATTWDDRQADRIDELHDKVDGLRQALAPLVPGPAATSDPIAKAASSITAGTIAKAVLLAILLGGIVGLGAGQLSACGSPAVQGVKTDTTAAGHAVLDCERKLAPAQLEAALVMLAVDAATYVLPGGAVDWNKLAELAIADATDLKACALAEYHAVTAAQPAASTAGLRLATGPGEPSPLVVALAKVKAARGVTAIVTPGGTI